jgi:hypothetical protein
MVEGYCLMMLLSLLYEIVPVSIVSAWYTASGLCTPIFSLVVVCLLLLPSSQSVHVDLI